MASNPQLAFAIRAMNESQRALKEVSDDLKGVTEHAEKAGGGMGKFSDTLKTASAVAGGFLAANAIQAGLSAVTGFLGGAVDAAKDLGESVNAMSVVFGTSAGKITDWGNKNANAFGLSNRAFNQLVTPLGAMLQNYGFSADEAADKSIDLTKRAADMASVFNVDVGTALEAIQAGLRGESDPLEKFGVGLNAAAIESKALAMTGKDVASALTDQEKKTASLALIMEQTDKVAGDFANTSDGLANSQRISAAKTEELQAKLGEKLLPVTLLVTQAKLKLTEGIVNGVMPAMEWLSTFVGNEVVPVLKDIGEEALPVVKDAFAQVQQTIEGLQPVADAILKFFKDNPEAIAAVSVVLGALLVALFPIPAAIIAITTAGTLLLAHWDDIRNKVDELVTKFQTDFPALWRVVEFVWDDIKNKIETAMAVIRDIIAIVTALIHGDWDAAWQGVRRLVSDVFDGIATDIANKMNFLADIVRVGGEALARAIANGIRDGWHWITDIVDSITEKLNPLNWDFPGLSPFQQAFRHAGQIAMQALAEGTAEGKVILEGAVRGAILTAVDALELMKMGFGRAADSVLQYIAGLISLEDALADVAGLLDRVTSSATAAGSAVGSVGGAAGTPGGIGREPIIIGEDPSGKPVSKPGPEGADWTLNHALVELFGSVVGNRASNIRGLVSGLTGLGPASLISAIVGALNSQTSSKMRVSEMLSDFAEEGSMGASFLKFLRKHGLSFDRGGWLMPGLTLAVNNTGRPERVIPAAGEVHVHFHGGVFMGDQRQAESFAEMIGRILNRRQLTSGGLGLLG